LKSIIISDLERYWRVMKRFYDVVPRKKIKKWAQPKNSHKENFFWGKDADIPQEKSPPFFESKKFKTAFHRSALVLILLASLLAFSYAKAVLAQNEIEKLNSNVKDELESILSNVERGDLKGAIESSEQLKDSVSQIKLKLQSLGQDSGYFSLIAPSDSKFANIERMYDAVNLAMEAMTEIKNISENSLSLESERNEDYLFDGSTVADTLNLNLNTAESKLGKASKLLSDINPESLGQRAQDIENARDSLEKIRSNIEELKDFSGTGLGWLFDKKAERKILIIFQNNAELRGGSGGSLGSFGVANISNGKIINIDFGKNIYKLDHEFEAKETIKPPEDLSWVVSDGSWTLKDSGWAVDGLEAMKKIEWLYEKESGEQVDGVFIADATAVISLMDITGPIELPAYDKVITKENFRSEIEQEVHKDYFTSAENLEENEPKKIISEMLPVFLNKLVESIGDKDKIFGLISILQKNMAEKDMLIYMKNDDFQKYLSRKNLSGEINQNKSSYLYVNNSNIDGLKSSLSVDESIKIKSEISNDGIVINKLNIIREHKGVNSWPDGTNRNLVRILLSNGVNITSFETVSGNFEQYRDNGYKNGKPYWLTEEAGRFELRFWMTTEPGERSEANIEYTADVLRSEGDEILLPLIFQKQPGANADKVEYELTFPENWTPTNITNFDSQNQTIKFSFTLDRDKKFLIKFSKP
jgi:hypothetical protein